MALTWIPVVWSMIAGACLAVGLIHFVAWLKQVGQRAHLAFGVIAVSFAAIALCELLVMRAQTPGEFGVIMRWTHVPVFTAVISIVVFVRTYFRAGRLWLAYCVCGLRLLALILNFHFEPNLNYRAITSLQQIEMFGGGTISVAVGVANPWARIGELSSLLLLLFVVDASLTAWRRGGRIERRRAAVVGGSLVFWVVVAAVSSALLHAGIIHSVYLISSPFLAVVAAISFELGADVVRSVQLAAQLQTSEADLRQSDQRLEQAAEAAKLGMLEWDIDRDEIWATDQGRALFGFAPAERIDFNRFLNALHPEDRDAVREAVTRSCEESGSYQREFRVVLPAGRVRWIATRGHVDVDAAGKAVLMRGVSFDITERKQAEERFQRVVEAAPYGMIIVNNDSRITFVNASIEADFGYSRQELVGESIEMLIPERFHDRHSVDRGNFLADPSARTTTMGREVVGRRKDGSEVPLEIVLTAIPSSEGVSVLATVIDISERKQRDDRLWQERAFLWQVIDINPSLIFAKDRQGRFTLVNKAVADLYGTTVRDLVGKTDADFNRNVEEVEFFRRADLEVMDTLQERFIAEERITDAAGKRHWLQTVKRPILGKDGTASQVLGSATDITARKQAELELERQRDELAHLSRVTMLSELSGSLAHELNQPLAAILSNAQAALRFLAHDDPNLDEVRDILRDIVDDDKRAGEVIQGLRLLLKKGEMRYEPFDMNEVVRDVLRLVRSDMLNADVGLSIELAPALPSVSGDRVQLQQVLLNLVVNGCDAMAGSPEADRQLVVSTERADGECIRVCVADQGRGIPADDLERVFEPFFTTKAEGLGLGLAVCRQIISAHGGRLWATNNAGRGTRFCINMPANSGDTA